MMDPSPLTPSTVRCGATDEGRSVLFAATNLSSTSSTEISHATFCEKFEEVSLGELIQSHRTKTDTRVIRKRRKHCLPAFSYIYSRRRDVRRGCQGGRALWFGREQSGSE
jgi:hypothetical protein